MTFHLKRVGVGQISQISPVALVELHCICAYFVGSRPFCVGIALVYGSPRSLGHFMVQPILPPVILCALVQERSLSAEFDCMLNNPGSTIMILCDDQKPLSKACSNAVIEVCICHVVDDYSWQLIS